MRRQKPGTSKGKKTICKKMGREHVWLTGVCQSMQTSRDTERAWSKQALLSPSQPTTPSSQSLQLPLVIALLPGMALYVCSFRQFRGR